MKLTEYTSQLILKAMADNAFRNLLCGLPPYAIPDREGCLTTDRIAVLTGIYSCYESDSSVKAIFEQTLLQLLQGSTFDVMTAFDYIWRCKMCEIRGTAPFALATECIAALRQTLDRRRNELVQYKDRPEFGSTLPGGALEYTQNIAALLTADSGRSLWD